MVANIDIAPTLYQLAGIQIPSNVDGLSLVNLFVGGPWRNALLFEGWPPRGHYTSIHTERYVYSETKGDISEFYDLQTDPYEMTSQINNPAYKDIIDALRQQLHLLVDQHGTPPRLSPELIPTLNPTIVPSQSP